MDKQRIGNQSPTTSVILPYDQSLGDDAVKIYNSTGQTAQVWQSTMLDYILAVNDDGLWVHTKFGYSVPRRNGKNEVVAMRELYGLKQGEQILHTAHRTTTSRSAWERLTRLLEKAGIHEIKGDNRTGYTSGKSKGQEYIFLSEEYGGGRISFRTRTTTGGLGEGFDLLIIDEAQEYQDDQETALKYVVSDSHNPQTIFCGTPPTPVSGGTVFTKLRKNTLEGGTQNTGWAEWSVDEMSDIHDVELWYRCNPSMGTILNERKVADEIGDDEVDFNIQRLGLWIKYNQKSAISPKEWESCKVVKPKLTGKLFVGIKYGHDNTNVALAVACKTIDGIFVEVIDCKPIRDGNDWMLAFIKNADVYSVTVDGANGQSILIKDMQDARIKKPIAPTVREIIEANAMFEQGVLSKTIQHGGQTGLANIVGNCEKRAIGANGGFGFKSTKEGAETALMDSVILAHWACATYKPPRKQKISY